MFEKNKIFIERSKIFKKKNNCFHNIILGSTCTLLVLITSLARFLQNSHSINQILFGFSIGFSIFYIFFEKNSIKYDKR